MKTTRQFTSRTDRRAHANVLVVFTAFFLTREYGNLWRAWSRLKRNVLVRFFRFVLLWFKNFKLEQGVTSSAWNLIKKVAKLFFITSAIGQ